MPKKRNRYMRALPPATAPPREVIIHHPPKKGKKHRDAGGGMRGDLGSSVIPVLGGIAGGTAAVLGSQRWNTHPGLVAAGAAAAGLAAASMGKQAWLRQAGAGAVVGAAVVGAVPYVTGMFQNRPAQTNSQPPKKRGAEGDGFVTRVELDDALSKLADSHKEVQKQQTCDLLTALRDEIKKVIAEGPNGPGLPAPTDNRANTTPLVKPPSQVFIPYRGAEADEYTRNAYGEDLRDAEGDEYMRNAYGDDIRDAEGDEYQRNAYGGERDAGVYDERDAVGYDERDASGYDERDAGGNDERDAAGDERDAAGDEPDADSDERNADDLYAQQLASMSGGGSM